MDEATVGLARVKIGLFLSLAAILLGFCLGGFFGANEDGVKSYLGNRAAAVMDTVYRGNRDRARSARDKGWSYLKRAHLHAGAIGAASLAAITLLALMPVPAPLKTILSLDIGLGGFGYPLYWLLVALRVPSMGSSTAAKESLSWLAIPSAGMLIVGIAAMMVLSLLGLRRSKA